MSFWQASACLTEGVDWAWAKLWAGTEGLGVAGGEPSSCSARPAWGACKFQLLWREHSRLTWVSILKRHSLHRNPSQPNMFLGISRPTPSRLTAYFNNFFGLFFYIYFGIYTALYSTFSVLLCLIYFIYFTLLYFFPSALGWLAGTPLLCFVTPWIARPATCESKHLWREQVTKIEHCNPPLPFPAWQSFF
jgi:hypothetical protein